MRIIVFVAIFFTFASLFSQTENKLSVFEAQLLSDYNNILKKDPFKRDMYAWDFYETFAEILHNEETFEYEFSTLNKIGSILSFDKSLRIITWNIPVGINENLYFGIVQYYGHKSETLRVVKLNDREKENLHGNNLEWHGALYYEVVTTKHDGQMYYTLLGFSFNDAVSNKKVIDILSINELDELYFCKDMIFYDNRIVDRLEFIYNEKATMSLRYDAKDKVIIFDHLSPSKPSLEGKFEFYGPDFTYDALKFDKGIWQHITNIGITNW